MTALRLRGVAVAFLCLVVILLWTDFFYTPLSQIPKESVSPRRGPMFKGLTPTQSSSEVQLGTVASGSPSVTALGAISFQELEEGVARLLGPDTYGQGCPADCGCPRKKKDCPRHYSIADVEASATARLDASSSMQLGVKLELRQVEALSACSAGKNSTNTGGYCLGRRRPLPNQTKIILTDGREYDIPVGHVEVSERIASTLVELATSENLRSISDYGAGVGQYGRYLKEKLPQIIYRGFDGAGDIEAYTKGFVRFADLTLPVDHPKSDWVMSLEVGEHIPSKFEGVFIRNLHRHNCRGVILSWGVLGQGGSNHINCHSNWYIVRVFEELGYKRDTEMEDKLRNPNGNHRWFVGSAMAFRRNQNVC